MNKCIIEVERIRSYQTVIGKTNRGRHYRKPEYKKYQEELAIGMRKLKRVPVNTPLFVSITFNVNSSSKLREYAIKSLETDRTVKIYDNKELAEINCKDYQYIEEREPDIKYGAIPDIDNAKKIIYDTLQELNIIDDDNRIVKSIDKRTFFNDKNTIEIEIVELDVDKYIKGEYE